jgi:hemolysin type calcium-binding protein
MTHLRIRLLAGLASVIGCFSVFVAPAHGDPLIAAAGSIACDTSSEFYNEGLGSEGHCHQTQTSDLLVSAPLSAVLTLGDNQYHVGSLEDFNNSFGPSWGRLKPIIHPQLGNREYSIAGARGYFDYFNGVGRRTGPAGERGKGYYSFDVGSWHLIALNSGCDRIDRGPAADGCAVGSPQERWLRSDLATHRNSCTLAYWHAPRFNSGLRGNSLAGAPFWDALYEAGADVILGGDPHHYERFAPQTPNGDPDPMRGIREFVAGTGGAFFTSWSSLKPNSEIRENKAFGVLTLALHGGSYEWRFLPEAGKTFTDYGSGACHGRTPGFGPAAANPAPAPQPHSKCTITGTDGDDRLAGTPKKDIICGLGGDDRIRGRGGNDVILAGAGSDRVYGGAGNDRIYGGRGNDVLRGQSGNDRVVGQKGKDQLYGNRGRDSISSRDNRRREWVFGGAGRDSGKVDRGDHPRSVERLSRR